MRKFDVAIFDLDGTLLNTLEDLADSVNKALSQNGYPTLPYERYSNIIGKGALNLITQSLPEAAREESIIHKVHAEFSEIYALNCHVKTGVYEGIIQALKRIEETGITMAVLSNKPDRYMESIRERYFGEIGFAAFRGKLDGVVGKPDSEGVRKLADDIGVTLENSVYIGDSSVDMQTAKNSDMFACGVLWGFRTRDELETYGADRIVANPEELADFIVENVIC